MRVIIGEGRQHHELFGEVDDVETPVPRLDSGTFDGITTTLTDDDSPLHPDALVAYARKEGLW